MIRAILRFILPCCLNTVRLNLTLSNCFFCDMICCRRISYLYWHSYLSKNFILLLFTILITAFDCYCVIFVVPVSQGMTWVLIRSELIFILSVFHVDFVALIPFDNYGLICKIWKQPNVILHKRLLVFKCFWS